MTAQIPGATITARRGTRRSPAQLSALMRTTMDKDLALKVMDDDDLRQKAIATAKVFWWDGRFIHDS